MPSLTGSGIDGHTEAGNRDTHEVASSFLDAHRRGRRVRAGHDSPLGRDPSSYTLLPLGDLLLVTRPVVPGIATGLSPKG